MKTGSYFMSVAAAVAGLALVTQASADVYSGGTVTFQYYSYGGTYDSVGSPSTFATPGSDTFLAYFTVSVSGDQITYTYLNDTTWSPSATSLNSGGLYVDNGAVIYSDSGVPPITSVKIDPASMLGSSGFNASDVTFNSGAVAVTWMNQSFAAGDTVILDVNSVPEPASWTLMILGIGGLGASLRLSAARRRGACQAG
jgi:hypothetical protein